MRACVEHGTQPTAPLGPGVAPSLQPKIPIFGKALLARLFAQQRQLEPAANMRWHLGKQSYCMHMEH